MAKYSLRCNQWGINIFKTFFNNINNPDYNLQLVSNQYTLFDSSRFSHSDCGSSTVKTYADKQTLLEEKYWRTVDSNQQPLNCEQTTLTSGFPKRAMRKM